MLQKALLVQHDWTDFLEGRFPLLIGDAICQYSNQADIGQFKKEFQAVSDSF